MAYKMLETKIPYEVVDLFEPLFDCLRNESKNKSGHVGGVILSLREDGSCVGAFFPSDDFRQLQDLVKKLRREVIRP